MRSARRRSYSYAIRLRAKVCEAHFVLMKIKMMVRKKESDIYGSEEKAGDRGEPAL